MHTPEHLIVWDLDHTLGVFDALAEVQDESMPVTVRLRPGIADALLRLSSEGFGHTVLTLASPRYAHIALRGSGLHHHFLEIAGAGQRPKGDVQGIADAFGISLDQCAERMVFVGDHPLYDPPCDPRLVFHLEPHAMRRPACVVADLLIALRDLGAGSLRGGFDELASRCAARDSSLNREIRRVVHADLGDLLLLARADGCQVIVFDDLELVTSSAPDIGTPVTFTPADLDDV